MIAFLGHDRVRRVADDAVLHLLAMAHSAGVDLTLEDFSRISDKTPQLIDMKPGGKYVHEVITSQLPVIVFRVTIYALPFSGLAKHQSQIIFDIYPVSYFHFVLLG